MEFIQVMCPLAQLLKINSCNVQGLTVEVDENGNLIVARILSGSTIERQGLLKPGDVIIEVNDVAVSSPEDLRAEVSATNDTVRFKVLPSQDNDSKLKGDKVYLIVLFLLH